MILHGNQRGGAKDLAIHLLKEENEHVDVYELRGFMSDDLVSALNESYAISKGTKAKQFLYSLSLNPPLKENVSTKDFENAINRVEKKLGLDNQPRAIVFHEKQGPHGFRRHAHAVWSRIDTAKMKAINLPHSKLKLRDVSKELFIEHGWKMPRGLINSAERNPDNFTLAQWQQAKRNKKDPRDIKRLFRECWAASDSKASFQSALKEQGYKLARGDRRGFVALNHRCEVFSVPKWAGVKTKDVRTRLGNEDDLPSVAKVKAQIASDMTVQLTQLQNQQASAVEARTKLIDDQLRQLVTKQRRERQELKETHAVRQQRETKQRQARFNKGLRGILDRFTGKRTRIKTQNEYETMQAKQRDAQEKDQLIFKQTDQRQTLQRRIRRLEEFKQNRTQSLSNDIERYHDINEQRRDVFERMQRKSQRDPTMER